MNDKNTEGFSVQQTTLGRSGADAGTAMEPDDKSNNESGNNDGDLSEYKGAAIQEILAARSAHGDKEGKILQASVHAGGDGISHDNTSGDLSEYKNAAVQEILAAQSAHSDSESKKLQSSVHGSSFHSSNHHRTATAADAVAAAKEQARNTAAYNLGAWAVIERGHNISITPREMVGRSDYNQALQDMEDGMSVDSIVESEDEFFDDPDLEYEEVEAANEEGLARAVKVEEDDEIDPAYLPAGLEFDPDAKPPEFIHRQSRYRAIRFYCMVAAAMALIVVVGGVLGWQFRQVVSDALPDRAVLGIREYVVGQLLSLGVAEHVLQDPTNPYRLALDWIQNVDTMALTPYNGTKFTQRFLVAYLYFATSVHQPWSNGCGPVIAAAVPDGNNENSCVHSFTRTGHFSDGVPVEIAGTRWLGPDDECTWGGVECDLNGDILVLELSGSNMTGSFPEGIAGFPFLRRLTFSHGGLAGPLPAILGAMKHLAVVFLDGNKFTGPIPESWYNSRSLQRVNVGANNLTGIIPPNILLWKDLKAVLLFENQLTGSIPSAMGESLFWFSAYSNALSGTIPPSLMLDHLNHLELSRNLLTGTIPTEIGRTSLRWLAIQFNQLNGTIPVEMSNLSSLWALDVSNNQLSGTIQALVNMTDLQFVRIENNNFSGTLPPELGRLKVMSEFIASGNKFLGTVPRKIYKLRPGLDGRDATGVLLGLQLDCSFPVGATLAEISCPDSCCSACCDADGKNCRSIIADR